MARTVQRQAPPYLLVAFVILFLIAAAMAAVFWVQRDAYRNDKLQMDGVVNRLASPQERGSPSAPLRELLGLYDNPPPGQPRQSVISQLMAQNDELCQLITGERGGFAEAKAKAEDAAKGIQSTPGRGLAVDIKELQDRFIAKENEAKTLANRVAQLSQELKQTEEAREQQEDSFAEKQEELETQKNASEKKLEENHKRYLEEQQRAKADLDKERSDLNKEIAGRNQQLNEIESQLREKDEMISRLRAELDRKRGPLGSETVTRQPDGKILQVLDRAEVCYINIGSKQRVVPGLTFSVYGSSAGIPENGEGKARIIVSTVQDSVSECRIVSHKAGDPIIVGDLVANVAFDTQRKYTFVVEGRFDLRGAGQPSAEEAKEVRLLINRSGGEVVDQVGVQTDFVVLGEEPIRPPKPSDSAQETVWAVYHSQMQDVNRYQEVKEAATNMHIPILNTNRFLAFVGYAPSAGGK
jgi:hypothetical protein